MIEIQKMPSITLFDNWTRNVTNTEYLAERLRNSGAIELSPPDEYSDVYRVQPKITGCERRRALCYQLGYGCEDIGGRFDGRLFFGIDLLSPVSELAKADVITLSRHDADGYLWVCVKRPIK